MARQLRLDHEGALWYTARGNERRKILGDDDDRQSFLDYVARAALQRKLRGQAGS